MAPRRGFPQAEFESRTQTAQAMMAKVGLDALLLTTAQEVYYFTGYLTRFWESPSRPWFLVLPAHGKPIAVIPAIGAALMSQTWVDDIRTWASPAPQDEGVTLLRDTLAEVVGANGRIGVPSGAESHLRMPLADFKRLKTELAARAIEGDAGIISAMRMIKSTAEVEKITHACAIAGRAFARVPDIAPPGTPLSTIFRSFQALCLDEGADWVPYLAGAGERGGYSDVISPAHDRALGAGDVLMLDTGLVWDGYFCDYNRNWCYGAAAPEIAATHHALIDATQAGFEAAKPGATAADLYAAMAKVVGDTDAGRLGHGLGLSLTEWPSLIPSDQTELKPGMVLTLEPAKTIGGKLLVHEENIVITDEGAKMLSPASPHQLAILS